MDISNFLRENYISFDCINSNQTIRNWRIEFEFNQAFLIYSTTENILRHSNSSLNHLILKNLLENLIWQENSEINISSLKNFQNINIKVYQTIFANFCLWYAFTVFSSYHSFIVSSLLFCEFPIFKIVLVSAYICTLLYIIVQFICFKLSK